MKQDLIVQAEGKENSVMQRPKIIKRYGNRKLYDTEQSSYVVLNDIAKMIRNQEDVRVIDNETKDDITSITLTQIIFGAEKKTDCSAPLNILKNIIKKGDGSFSNFLAELGFFKLDPNRKQVTTKITETYATKGSVQESHKSLEERIATAATSTDEINDTNKTPDLPFSSQQNRDLE